MLPLFHDPRHFPVGEAAESDEEAATREPNITTTKVNFSFLFFMECHKTLEVVIYAVRVTFPAFGHRLIRGGGRSKKATPNLGGLAWPWLIYPADRFVRTP